jgi:outer membrane protein assembly complex protein YaeT
MRRSWICLSFLLGAFLCSVSFARETSPQQGQRVLDLSTLSPKAQSALFTQMPVLHTSHFTKTDLDNLIRYLVTEDQFDSAQIMLERKDSGQEVYHLNVGKARHIAGLRFVGNSALSETEVRRAFDMGEHASFDQQALIEGGERVRKVYQDHGYQNAVVDLEFTRLSPSEVQVTVKINEGLQTRVTAVVLKASNPRFKEFCQHWLEKKLLKEPLTEHLLNEVHKNIREELSSRNYLKADLQGPDISLNKEETQATLTYTVDRSDEYILDIRGTNSLRRYSVERALDLDHFYSSNPSIAPELGNRVKNYYLGRGYARVEVNAEEVEGSNPYQKRIIVNVSEGPRVKIHEINVTGRISKPEKYYTDFIRNHSSDLIDDGYYNRDDLDVGFKNLVIDRQNEGYLKARIISTRASYNKDRNEVTVVVNMDEGPLTQLDTVTFEGNSSFTEAQLLEVVGLKMHEPLRLNQLDEAVHRLRQFYRNSGYLEMSLLNEHDDLVTYNNDNTLAYVNFKISEGPKIVVAAIVLEGNSLTRDYVIMKELEFKIGDTLTPQLIDETTSRLQRLGLFSLVDIHTLEEKTQISQRTVVVRVSDRDPGLFRLGAGVTNELGITLRGYTGIGYNNIMGTARAASVRLDGNYNISRIRYLERTVTLSYMEPYLFDTRVRGRVTYNQSVTLNPLDYQQATDIKQIIYSVEENITSHFFVSYDLWNSALVRDFYIKSGEVIDDLTIATTGPTFDLDYRDHPFNPTSGTFTQLQAEYASPQLGSSPTIRYWRGTASFTHYWSPWRPGWTWANSIRGGYLQNLSNNPVGGVPWSNKGLILGGESTIRGYLPGEAFPNAYDLGTDSFKLTTEAKMYLLKTEIRFPIYGNIGGAVFYDGGAVTVKGVNIPDPYRDSAGVGMRYATPVGAVSLELACKFKRLPGRGESECPFQFAIGTF